MTYFKNLEKAHVKETAVRANTPLSMNTFSSLKLPAAVKTAKSFTDQLAALIAAADATNDKQYADSLRETAKRWRVKYADRLPTVEKAHVKETASRVYYSIMERLPSSKMWGAQWGSYDKKEVQQELRDMLDSGSAPKRNDLIVVATGEKREDIEAAASDLNKNFPDGTKERVIRYYVGPKSVV